MTTALVNTTTATIDNVTEQDRMIGQIAKAYAKDSIFDDYSRRKSERTRRVNLDNLATFAAYLGEAGINRTADQLQSDPTAWSMMTDGLLVAYREWLLVEGYAIGTINLKLSTVKTYCKLATQAGTIDVRENAMIRLVQGFSKKEARRIDALRPKTRLSREKASPTRFDVIQARTLKTQPPTPQGRRDALLMSLLIDHGLRAGEATLLKVGDFDLTAETFTFYRPKVDMVQTHRLSEDTLAAVRAYIGAGDAPTDESAPILRGSRKGGQLSAPGMRPTNLSQRVGTLGKRAGVDNLSAHDCRHFWASNAARSGTDAIALRDAGGWSSLLMPGRYVEAAKIANESVIITT